MCSMFGFRVSSPPNTGCCAVFMLCFELASQTTMSNRCCSTNMHCVCYCCCLVGSKRASSSSSILTSTKVSGSRVAAASRLSGALGVGCGQEVAETRGTAGRATIKLRTTFPELSTLPGLLTTMTGGAASVGSRMTARGSTAPSNDTFVAIVAEYRFLRDSRNRYLQ